MARTTVYKQDTRFWIGMIDMITTILIIFLLVTFIDKILNQRNIEMAVVNQKRSKFINLLQDKFPTEIETDSTIRLNESFDYLRISFSDKILFNPGEYKLERTGQRVLASFSTLVKDYYIEKSLTDIKKIQVEGHTDETILRRASYPRNNWELGSARALKVVAFFIEKGLPGDIFSATSHESNVSVKDSGDKSIDRRIELRVSFDEHLNPETK